MSASSDPTAGAVAGLAQGARRSGAGLELLARLGSWFAQAWRQEVDSRRLFLWLPVAAGAGAIASLTADRDPSLPFAAGLFALTVALAFLVRQSAHAFLFCAALAAALGGFASASLRTALVAAPVIDRIRIVKMTGFVEEMNIRREGARFLLRVTGAEGLAPGATPWRVRLTTRRAPEVEAGAHIAITARLVPPARAVLPNGYDFARDAWFARIGAVGNVLGGLRAVEAAAPAPLSLRVYAAIDRARNGLARRIVSILDGPAAAVAVAMVTGKRDYLEDSTKDVIREAGIFHIITISGVQMTLVAGIFFWGFRRLLALSRTLALNYPIKSWAALMAMAGATVYDIGTGSRVGTERALVMTLILLGAVVCGRRAMSMRNLALAVLFVVIFEPEALLGASFQLSFAAVAGLIAVFEARMAARLRIVARPDLPQRLAVERKDRLLVLLDKLRGGPLHVLGATACATGATASFMAYDFHELSPYVLIGNPLTLTIIEMFAVPGALVGAILYPLGLDAFVWRYVGLGIDFVLWAASWLAAAPAATLHLVAFSPVGLIFLALAVLSLVIWRTPALRLTAAPFIALGLWGVLSAQRFDLAVMPTGEALAVRAGDGRLVALGKRPSLFAVEQWLRADGDGRPARAAVFDMRGGEQPDLPGVRCDRLGCVAQSPEANIALVLDAQAFAEDCGRADVVVSPLQAPPGCGARLVLDRTALRASGAVTARFIDDRIATGSARAKDEDRPWSRAPRPVFARAMPGEGEPNPDFVDDDRDAQPFR